MKQPLMLIPPAQAEVLSDNSWADTARESTQVEDRFAPCRWLDDDLPDEAIVPYTAQPGESPRRLLRTQRRAA